MKKLLKNPKEKIKSPKGLSMITLVITIVVVVIIATISIVANLGTIDESAIADYRHELKNVEVSVSAVRISNQKGGIGEEFKEEGFYPVLIENPPQEFVSFEENEFKGYVVDLSKIKENETKKGKDYKKYIESLTSIKTITFGNKGTDNDVFIYDATGKVYYAKGFYIKGGVYYSDVLTKDGPIITADLNYNEERTEAVITISVAPEVSDENLKVYVNNSLVNKEDDGTYKYTATNNGVYIITAEEDSERVSIKRVGVTEIKSIEYKITYHFKDGSENEQVIKKSNEPIRLKYKAREGYILEGWSKSDTSVTSEYMPGSLFNENADTDLYAVWKEGEPAIYTITFNANGGKGAPKPIKKTQRLPVTLPSGDELPTKTGSTFVAWSISSDKENVEERYAEGAEYTKDNNVTLFAIWQESDVRVEAVVVPEGAGNVVGTGVKEVGNIVYVTAVANKGYAFDKWKVLSNNTKLENTYAEKTKFTMPGTKVTLQATFKETSYDYVIKYDSNGGSNAPNTQYKKQNQDITISTMLPTRSGYKFTGWDDTALATTVKYHPGDTYSKNASAILYAVWEKNTDEVTLTFDSNGGTKAPKSITKPKDTIISIPTEKPVRNNLLFLGWSEDKEATVPEYRISDSYTLAENETLYAVWSDSEKAVVNITAGEENDNLVLFGNAVDNGGIVKYAWTNEFYSESNQNKISWVSLSSRQDEVSIKKDVLKSGMHYFYVQDIDGNISYASIDVYKLTFKSDVNGSVFVTKYKAAGFGIELTKQKPKKTMQAFKAWKSEKDNRVYSKHEKYILDSDETFVPVWGDAIAYIPSTDTYYLSTQEAVEAIPTDCTDYVLIKLVANDPSDGVTIKAGQKVSLNTETFMINSNNTTISIEEGGAFKLVGGTVKGSNYAIRNFGKLEVSGGTINAKYAVYNAKEMVMGDSSIEFAKDSAKLEGTRSSYIKANAEATLAIYNGSFTDYRNTETGGTYSVDVTGATIRDGFKLRKIGDSTTSSIITTIVQKLKIAQTVVAGTEAKPVEKKITLSCDNNNFTFQYSLDGGTTWITGKEVNVIDNGKVYGRIVDQDGVADIIDTTVSDIVELKVTFDAQGKVTNPSQISVKYKRTYGDKLPAINDSSLDYYFLGWYTASTGGTQVKNTDNVTIATDHTLYAQWKAKYATVTYSPGAYASSLSANCCINGTWSGYYASGSYTGSSPQQMILIGNTYRTVFVTKENYETYIKSGGTATEDGKYYAVNRGMPSNPSSNDYRYEFECWRDANGNKITSSSVVSITGDHTITASWSKVSCKCSKCSKTYLTDCNCTNSICSKCSGNVCTYHCPGHTYYCSCSACSNEVSTSGARCSSCSSNDCSTCGSCYNCCPGHSSGGGSSGGGNTCTFCSGSGVVAATIEVVSSYNTGSPCSCGNSDLYLEERCTGCGSTYSNSHATCIVCGGSWGPWKQQHANCKVKCGHCNGTGQSN